MSTSDKEEARAEAWLRAQGYEPSRPTWLPPGRNPDFWTESTALAPQSIWVEVKSIDPDDSTAAMEKFSKLISSARPPSGLNGHAILQIEADTVEQSIRWVLKAFAARGQTFAGKKVSLAFIQQMRDSDQEYRIDIDSEPPMVIWARASELPLDPGTVVRDEAIFASARVHKPNGSEITGPAYQFFEPRHPTQCALVVRLDPADRVLEHVNFMCAGSGQTRERTARVLESANGQIKAACATRDAAGIVVLSPSGPFGDNDQMMQAAIYGDYTVPIELENGGLERGQMFHGRDGVFRPNKNTHISAAVHVRREGPATFFPNPHARHVIPDDAPIFAGAKRANVAFK